MITFAVQYRTQITNKAMSEKKYVKKLKSLKKELEDISSKRAKVLTDSTRANEEEYFAGEYKTYREEYNILSEYYDDIRKSMGRIVAMNQRSFIGIRGCHTLNAGGVNEALVFEDEFGIKYTLLVMDSNMELNHLRLKINDNIGENFIGNRYDFDERLDKSPIRVINDSSFLITDSRGKSLNCSISWDEELPAPYYFIALLAEGGYVVFREKVELKDK